jgi:aldose 1-epimerase
VEGDRRRAARLADPAGGRRLEVWTTEPGMQLYTGNRLGGRPYERFAGVALETQKFPDSPNRPSFPSAVVRPGETYRSRTELRFSDS